MYRTITFKEKVYIQAKWSLEGECFFGNTNNNCNGLSLVRNKFSSTGIIKQYLMKLLLNVHTAV